ncbi:MoaD/ThiS family protein [Chitinimonas sp. PSY-7]|uniref:MoaD/ThiS family protein n=1 Tax=Chitinimonas sp. PSY-7 TaxID=3459088 RepID=UPI0040403BB7
MNIQVLYFARLREVFGLSIESVNLSGSGLTVADLLAGLRGRGGVWAEELATDKVFRVAVDQNIADSDTPIPDGVEVAIFPPVTGG